MEQQQHWQPTLQPQGMLNRKMVQPQMEPLPFPAREAINILRGNIQLSGYDLKTIAITSALAHEGKSSIAFRLAKSMAGLGKKTIYVDCDIRNSMTMSRYDIQIKTIGLTEYLCGRDSMTNIIYKTDDQWMDMIFTGASAPNPSELVSGPLFEQLIVWLRENYDYVIVDTPPVNAVIDGALIAKRCDGSILVIESGLTERKQAIQAKRQLEYAGIKILGTVLNKVGTRKSGYGYGYGYGYDYGYGENRKSKQNAKKKKK
nr:CpsD/CapB family tyrosine-protein kinase [uncultured Marvinbryantia sp.]